MLLTVLSILTLRIFMRLEFDCLDLQVRVRHRFKRGQCGQQMRGWRLCSMNSRVIRLKAQSPLPRTELGVVDIHVPSTTVLESKQNGRIIIKPLILWVFVVDQAC